MDAESASLWSTETALAELDRLLAEIDAVAKTSRRSSEWSRWKLQVHTLLSDVFGEDSPFFIAFIKLPWGVPGQFYLDPDEMRTVRGGLEGTNHFVARKGQEAALEQLQQARGILLAARDELSRKGVGGVYRGKNTGPEASDILKIIMLAEKQLRKVMRDTPRDERAVQDAFEALLLGAGIEHSREKQHIEFSSKTYVPDFTMPRLDLAVEIKLVKSDGGEKAIIGQINDDIAAYSTEFGNILFVVYDVGFIRDADLFSGSFHSRSGVVIRVVKH